ncbi:PIG-L deacetylase family protein [Plantactinospora sp. B6F1]|uniref:PIG-L family deacetylase n=1 Tax=Plantactinospora sp. B6F1 TaxID=3158971 RepID=UPI00102CDAD7
MTAVTASDVPERALVVAAHADDVDFRCAGTLAAWCGQGTAVTLALLTDSAKGSHDLSLSDDEVAALRRTEQRAAAARVGYRDVRELGEIDGLLRADERVIEWLVRVIRDARPDVVLTYDPWAPYILHPDHTTAGDAAFRAVIRAREPRFCRDLADEGLPPWRVSQLWLFGAPEPDHIEDISGSFDTKLDAILCHRSQYETEMGFSEGDEAGRAAFVERMRAMFGKIGASGGFSYAESYRRLAL